MVRKVTSLRVDTFLWKELKKHCIDRDIDLSDWIEEKIKKDLKLKEEK